MWCTKPQCLQCFFPLSFFVDGSVIDFSFSVMILLFSFLAAKAFVSLENCWRQLWSTRAMIILSISSFRFCVCVILIIWKVYSSRSGLKPSHKKKLSSQLSIRFLISAHFTAPFLITSPYLAIVLKSD